jgi:thioredoxin-dependent peroxiredoxin
MIQKGQIAPDFTLSDQDGNMHTLSNYRGKKVLIYFYPKDDTPGCTTEACEIRDKYDEFMKTQMVVFGISADPVKKHKKFAEKYELPFPLLSDEEKVVCNLYGVWQKKKFMGREYMGIARTSFLIDEKGKIEKVFEQVTPKGHAAEVLQSAI